MLNTIISKVAVIADDIDLNLRMEDLLSNERKGIDLSKTYPDLFKKYIRTDFSYEIYNEKGKRSQ